MYNMQIPFSVFVYAYAVVAFGILVFSIVSVSQVVRYGMKAFAPYLVSALYLGTVLLVIVVTLLAVRAVDWSAAFTIGFPGVDTTGGGV